MGKYLFLLILLYLWAGGAFAAPPQTADLDALIQEARRAWSVPGMAVAIVRDGEVIYLKGHGLRSLAGSEGVTPDTLFPLASCSKAFTTATLAMLVEEGKLHWDDPVRKHLPWFQLSDPLADRSVLVRDLVCHRTGLRGHELLWFHAPWSPEEGVRRAGLLPLDRPFRTAFQYQSTMFTAAGLVASAAAGQPWEKLIPQRLFVPLAMTGARCMAPEDGTDLAVGHRMNRMASVEFMPRYDLSRSDPAGTIHASARDLAHWLIFHLAGGMSGGKRLLSERALAETHTPQMVIRLEGWEQAAHPYVTQMSYGMGWTLYDYRGLGIVGHGGLIDGYRAHLTMVPQKKLGIVILANLHRSRMNLALSNTLVDRLLGLTSSSWNAFYLDLGRRQDTEDLEWGRLQMAQRRPDTQPSRPLADYGGRFDHPAYGSVEITPGPRGLICKLNRMEGRLEHFHYDTFLWQQDYFPPVMVPFRLDASGAIQGLGMEGPIGVDFARVKR